MKSGLRIFMAAVALAACAAGPLLASAPVGAQTPAFTLPELPQQEPGPVVTLAEAVRRADSSNRSLLALREDVQIAAAKLQSSRSVLFPSLYGSMNYQVRDSAPTSVTTGQTGSLNSLSAGISLNVPLIAAQEWLSVDAARLGGELTDIQLEQARQVLLYSVAEAYYQAATALALIDVYKVQFDAAKAYLDLAEGRLAAGVGRITDVKSAQTDVVSAWTEIVKAGYSLADARDALALLMGTDQLPMPVSRPAPVPEPAVSDRQIDARWDLKVQRKQVTVLEKELKAGYMQFVPTLSGAVNYNVDVLGNSGSQVNDWGSVTAGLVLSVPLFDYKFYPALKSKKAGILQAQLQIDDITAQGNQKVREGARNLQKFEKLVSAATTKAALADDLLSLAEADYANGTGLAINVTDARRTSQAAHVELATVMFELDLGRLALNRELGVDISGVVTGR